ncbi:hypothetical protein ES702_00490 [subsurface metagenome]
MKVSKNLKKHIPKESVFKEHRFNPAILDVQEQKVIEFDRRVIERKEPEQASIFEHPPPPISPITKPPRIREGGRPERALSTPRPPPLKLSRAGQWQQILEQMQLKKNASSILPVGDEKVTVYCGYEPNKNYIAKEYFEAISRLAINEQSEIFVTIDSHPAPVRWSKEGVTKDGQAKRRQRVLEIENIARERALANGSDYLMIIECDLLPPPDAYRRLRTLIKTGADISFLPYTWHWINPQTGPSNRYAPVLAWTGKYPNMIPQTLKNFLSQPYPAKVTTCGFGCSMFSRKVFEKPFELDPYSIWCTDGCFAKRVEEETLLVLGDNRVFAQHICCKKCARRFHQGEPHKPVKIKELLDELFKNRNLMVKEI